MTGVHVEISNICFELLCLLRTVGTELYISALYKPHVCTRPLLHFGLNSGIPVIAARAISDLVRFTNTAMFVGMSTMRQNMYILKKPPS